MEEQFLTVEQVSKILQLHPYTVLKYIKDGKLRGMKLGRRYRLKKSDVDEFLERNGFEKTKEDKKMFKIQGKKEPQGGLSRDHYIIQ